MWQLLRDLLPEHARRSPHNKHITASRTLQKAAVILSALLPPDLRRKARPHKVVDGELTINVDHPAVALRIRQSEQRILQELQKDHPDVKRLALRVRPETTAPSG